jgi:hypothetical protein
MRCTMGPRPSASDAKIAKRGGPTVRRLTALEHRRVPSQLNRVATNGEYRLDVAFICWHPGAAL